MLKWQKFENRTISNLVKDGEKGNSDTVLWGPKSTKISVKKQILLWNRFEHIHTLGPCDRWCHCW